MQPLDPQIHYGITDRNFLDVHNVQMDLLPDKLHQLRWKLNQKAKNEPKLTRLNRRRQRKYHRPKGMSHYPYLEEIGLHRL